jgi:hypothetical protein
MDDAARAKAQANFKVTKEELREIVELYKARTYIEDLEYIQDKLGGVENVL